MKNLFKTALVFASFAIITSCEKDAGKLPNIAFKTASGYQSTNDSITAGSTVLIGIDASKAEDADVLKKFNISKTVNGGTAVTVIDSILSGAQGDAISYDYSAKLDTAKNKVAVYTFTVTNRDGLVGQKSLTLTTK